MERCPTCGMEFAEAAGIGVGFQDRGGLFDSLQCAVAGLGLLCDHCTAPILGRAVVLGGAVYCCQHCAGQGSREPAARAKHDVAAALANPAGAGRGL